ncbi:hypothetical protein NKH77_27370 [Streptomyces sp. M19]
MSITESPTAQPVTTERLLAVEQAVDVFAEGGFVIVHDDEPVDAGEPTAQKGDLLLAAEHTHEGALQQLLDHTSGWCGWPCPSSAPTSCGCHGWWPRTRACTTPPSPSRST